MHSTSTISTRHASCLVVVAPAVIVIIVIISGPTVRTISVLSAKRSVFARNQGQFTLLLPAVRQEKRRRVRRQGNTLFVVRVQEDRTAATERSADSL